MKTNFVDVKNPDIYVGKNIEELNNFVFECINPVINTSNIIEGFIWILYDETFENEVY